MTRPKSRPAPWVRRLLLILGYTLTTLCIVGSPIALLNGDELRKAHWVNPWAALGLVTVPLLLWWGTYGRDRRVARLRLGSVAPLLSGPQGWRVGLRDLPGVLRAIGFGLMVLAMTRPVDTLHPETADESGIDLIVVLDLSGSMQAVMENLPADLTPFVQRQGLDIPPTRLDAAKAVIRDFISRRKSDRIGVVVFGKEAYVLSPPTLDYPLLDHLVSKMELKLIDGSGTAIGDAVGVGAARLRRSTAKSKAIILLTDGDSNAGRVAPEQAAVLANKVGAKIFTIQIGDGSKSRVFTGQTFLGQPRFELVEYPVNPKLLGQLSQQTRGASYVATDAKALQASFHDVLNLLEKSRFEASIATFEELFPLLLLPGVLLVAFEALLSAFVLRRFP